MTSMTNQPTRTAVRIESIDLIRALTMVLMIFVNDLWSLKDIPEWLEHVAPGVDGMGLADTVFPAFLFIVGLSMPFALANRRAKGDDDRTLVRHVATRSLALLIMGVFLVNGETINEQATGIQGHVWGFICCFSFILIWNVYPKGVHRNWALATKLIGAALLLCMAIRYRGGGDGHLQRFAPQWWGILGLIGWSYLTSGLITIFAKNRVYIILMAWTIFCILSMVYKAGLVPESFSVIPEAIRGGTLVGLALGGVLSALIYDHYRALQDGKNLIRMLLLFAAILIILSFITRPFWGLSKLGATPAWLFLCSAITLLGFLAIDQLVVKRGAARWLEFVKPAGTDTLLCYFIPYFAYASTILLGLHVPDLLLTGIAGLFKSFLFALLCVQLTKVLNRAGIRLKL
jgi:hypothetical protein